MKILCKLKPSENTCCGCVDDQLRGYKTEADCKECLDRCPDYEILQFGHSLFVGDWAMVLDKDGNIKRVKLERCKRVRTLHTQSGIELENFAANMKKAVTSLR